MLLKKPKKTGRLPTPLGSAGRKRFAGYLAAVCCLCFGYTTVLAAGDPLDVVNNLSTIALACIIFSVLASSPDVSASETSEVTMVWSYIMQVIFNLLVLVGAVQMSDRIIKELLGL